MEIDKVFHNTIMYQDLEILQDYLDTFKLDPQLTSVLKKYKHASPFWKSDEKIFWIFEEILHDEAERVKQLNGVKTRNKVGFVYIKQIFYDIVELLLEATNDKKASSIDSRCVVCYENEICIKIQPCNHFVVCKSCFNRLNTCPMCRSKINKS